MGLKYVLGFKDKKEIFNDQLENILGEHISTDRQKEYLKDLFKFVDNPDTSSYKIVEGMLGKLLVVDGMCIHPTVEDWKQLLKKDDPISERH